MNIKKLENLGVLKKQAGTVHSPASVMVTKWFIICKTLPNIEEAKSREKIPQEVGLYSTISFTPQVLFPTKGVEMCWNNRPRQQHGNLVRQGIWHWGGCSWWRRGWGNLRKPENRIMGTWKLKRFGGATPFQGCRANLKIGYLVYVQVWNICNILTLSGGLPEIFCLWWWSSRTCLQKSIRHISQMRNTLLSTAGPPCRGMVSWKTA